MPLFFEKTLPREAHAGKFIFPLAAPPGLILLPEIEQIPEISVILSFGGILGKESNARGKFTEQPQLSTIFTTETLMLLTLVDLEKFEVKIWKLLNDGLYQTKLFCSFGSSVKIGEYYTTSRSALARYVYLQL